MFYVWTIIGSIAVTALLFGWPKSKPKKNKPWKPKKISWSKRLGLDGDFWDYAS